MSPVRAAFESLSVVIPTYNAAESVCDTLDSVSRYLERSGIESEIIVVDDGSVDDTLTRIRARNGGERILSHAENRGKGYAVRRGLAESRHAWALFMDADNATSPDHLDGFAPHAGGADILVGSRRLPGSVIARPQQWHRQSLGRTFPYLVRALCLRDIYDTQCGFKVFRRAVLEDILPRVRTDGFSFDIELLLSASRLGYRIVELPVSWDNPTRSTLHVGLEPPRMLADLLRIVWRHRRSRYAAPGSPRDASESG